MDKINLKLLVRPKVFWGSIIIFLLGISAAFYIVEENEKALRIFTQKQLAKNTEEKTSILRKSIDTIKAKKQVEEELVTEKERSFTLEKELEQKDRQIKLTLDRLEKEIAARREAEAHLMIAMKEKETLETKRFDKALKAVELEKIVVKSTSALVGDVLMVNKEYRFIIVDLGSKDNLKSGDVLSVYRNDEFIGRVQVERVEEKISSAAILPDWQSAEFKENDKVRGI